MSSRWLEICLLADFYRFFSDRNADICYVIVLESILGKALLGSVIGTKLALIFKGV
jgi:hypothetical protein